MTLVADWTARTALAVRLTGQVALAVRLLRLFGCLDALDWLLEMKASVWVVRALVTESAAVTLGKFPGGVDSIRCGVMRGPWKLSGSRVCLYAWSSVQDGGVRGTSSVRM